MSLMIFRFNTAQELEQLKGMFEGIADSSHRLGAPPAGARCQSRMDFQFWLDENGKPQHKVNIWSPESWSKASVWESESVVHYKSGEVPTQKLRESEKS
eukprot:CAMPEP_0184317472 /NCGR_PEP_ID=MMETSP1049-20130417/96864_1 /TAXON_ID=77928 /ORGANISM="Proteomonas sulcata, Strain CCMP704" /LENGTH=98 /DNA_ID=CAMNT_0026636863 /DNA_START=15 /DNA_END=307 /DNA_ORIENTATION=+